MSSIAIAGGSGGRTVLTKDTSYFVSTTGSDSNDGLTLGTAWATLQHAINFVSSSLDIAGFTITVNIGAGSFVGFGIKSTVGGGILQFLGAGVASTTITDGPNDGTFNFGECWTLNLLCTTVVAVDGVTYLPKAANSVLGTYVNSGSMFLGQFIPFTSNFTINASKNPNNILAVSNLVQTGSGTATLAGGGFTHHTLWNVQVGSFVFDSASWVITGAADTFNFAFVDVSAAGIYQAAGSFTGSAIGKRFIVTNAQIFNTGSLTFFPGTLHGVCANGGIYS